MRIAMLLPVADHPAVRAYALWTRSARDLSEALVQRGVEVTAVPIQDAGPLMPTHKSGVHGVESVLRLTHVFQRADDFQLIHDMVGFATLPFAAFIDTPVLSTVWFDMWKHAADMYQEMNQRVYYVAPSEQDRKGDLLYTDTLPWGVPVKATPFHESAEDHLVFLGSLRPKAGVEEAIELAKRTGRPLVLLGAVQDPVFFEREVAPHLDGQQVRHHDDPASPEADRWVGQATAVVHVGGGAGMQQLALLDALARGTPIVAIDDGHVPDFVRDGETGYRFTSAESAAAGMTMVCEVDRKACRERVLKERALVDMVPRLVALYERVIEQAQREDHRPWGYYRVLADEPDHKVKRLVVYPEKRLSLQRHRHRSEHWFLVEGEAMVVQDDEEVRMLPGQSIEIPKGCWHRIRNPGADNLTIIEVQTGEYFGEDDIERKEDDFGRAPGPSG
jgi:mannose-6-phosphate isomerase-like protein (cupin superfamily)